MSQVYADFGIEFHYPDEWEVSEERQGEELAITAYSPQSAFWTVTLIDDRPDPERVIEAVVAAFEQEYDEIDIYPARDQLCDRPTAGRDIDFFCLELLNVARARCFRSERFTVLVLYQGTDSELAELEPLFEQISKSLQIVGDVSDAE
ncbi:MAG: hypothetical protein ACKV0T_05225 [Planctomycetales bacterium]